MSDVDLDITEEPEAAAAETEATKANDQNTKKSNKDPLPDGWETPTAFAHRLTDELDEYNKESNPFRPQQVYGYVKNGKEFPSKNHTDGRVIVEIEPALAWVAERVEKRKERAAKKAAEAEGTGGEATTDPAGDPVA
jgi:hypothetical protein